MSKLVYAVNQMSTWTCMNIKCQGHSLILVQDHSDSTFSNFFSWDTAKPDFMWNITVGWGNESFFQMAEVIWPRWMPCPYMVKTWKNLLLWNQKADDLESLYAASDTRVLPSLFKWWPWVDLHLFYSKVRFGPLIILLNGKKLKECIFQKPLYSVI